MPVHDIGGRLYAGLSGDTKPTDLPDGWLFFETDTQDVYQRLAGSWTRILTLSHLNLTNVGVNDHHNQQHTLPSSSVHTGGITNIQHGALTTTSSHPHANMTGQGPADHHQPPIVLRKAANETVNNSATLQNDDDFSFAVAANGIYLIHMHLSTVIFAASDFQFLWDLPSGSTKYYQMRGWTAGTAGLQRSQSSSGILAFLVTASVHHVEIHGLLKIGGTGGTAQFQWAQQAAVAENTQLLADSFMVAIKQ